jgi:hypothetical protein
VYSELPWYRSAAHVPGIAVDLHPIDLVNLKSDPGQSGGCLRRQPLVDVILVNPAANLSRTLTDSRVQPRAPEHPALVRTEDPIDEILVHVELASSAAQPFDPVPEFLRFVIGPGHPGAKVVDALVNGRFQKRRVGRVPTTDDQSMRVYAVRWSRHARAPPHEAGGPAIAMA